MALREKTMGKAKIKPCLEKIKRFSREDKDTLAVFLFGSCARNTSAARSDIDICVVLNQCKAWSALELSQKKLEFLEQFPGIDIQIFQQIPLYIQKRVIKEGRLILCKDEQKLYDLVLRQITIYNDFERGYKGYLAEVENAG
ncbi:MAG: nucleotidyltransferase domain-containing protein [Candidatus Omnitrophota bacterium]